MKAVSFLAVLCLCCSVHAYDWSGVQQALEDAVANGAFPGAVVSISDKTGMLFNTAVGSFTYGIPPPADPGHNPADVMGTIFDMASCTKVSMTTTAIAQFYQRGELRLSDFATKYLGAAFAQNGKGPITILNLLLHDSGFFPDPNPFWSTTQFGCPETAMYHPLEVFTCADKIYANLLAQPLNGTVGGQYVYSDLNFITLMHVAGNRAYELEYVKDEDMNPRCLVDGWAHKSVPVRNECAFEAYVRKYVIEPAGMVNTGYWRDEALWPLIAPTENDTIYHHAVIQGYVHDPNAYAMGGVSGHAGVFSTAADMMALSRNVMFAPEDSKWMNATTAALFTKEYNHTFSSRALGWNTNDYTTFDRGWNNSCGTLAASTWMHVGYTGPMICGDPERQLIFVMMTNRVYPTSLNIKIRRVRQIVSTAVQQAYDAHNNIDPSQFWRDDRRSQGR